MLVAALMALAAPAVDPRTESALEEVGAAVGGLGSSARYAIAFADVGGDAREEALVYLVDRNACGSGGCSLIVLTPSAKRWRRIGQTAVTQLPVYRLLTRRSGWNDLAVGVGGGGAARDIAVLRFTGGRYPANPTVQPKLNRLPYGARQLLADTPSALVPVPR